MPETAGRGAPMHIAILSFDRPHYLREVLHSLRSQVSESDEIVLLQDGAINPHSGRLKGDDENIVRCIDVFAKIIPWGKALVSRDNLGIALNYERAEHHMFGTLGRPFALFLEDDLVLSPQYLAVIRSLLEMARAEARIAYVSAYGNMWATLAEQRANAGGLLPMHENWGFAMTREAWLDERPFRAAYLKLLEGKDYTERDNARIIAFYRKRGWTVGVTSQDAARWIAAAELGKVRLTTFACHARYIGEYGVHFTPAHYYGSGFHKTLMFDQPAAALAPPSTAQIESWLETERQRFRGKAGPFYRGHDLDAACDRTVMP